jgi:predicted house-cleaning noncanonical NTP pyrophosphatase (MazG superfamily)
MAMEIDKENALNIILHYGLKHQIRKFAEESYELVETLLCEQMDSDHVAEEIADCCVMIEQFKQLFCFSDAEIVEIANSKIKRQIERIKANKDEKDDYIIRNNRNM